MKILGIDYSLNGTGLSIYNGKEITFKKVFTNTKKEYQNDKQTFILAPKFNSVEEKIDWVVQEIISCTTYDYVCMEDHIGSYYNWMDGYGIIKHYLRKNNTPYLMVSPTQLKKFAGSGKADKDKMSYFLKESYGFDFDYIGKMANNIVDATWLAILGYNYHRRFIDNKKIKITPERLKIITLLYAKNKESKN